MVTGETEMNLLTDGPFRIGTVLSKSLGILRRNIVLFTAIAGITCAPEFLITAMSEGADSQPGPQTGAQIRALFVTQATTAIMSTLSAATILYLVLHQVIGRPIRVGEAISTIFSRLLPLVGIALLSLLALIGPPLLTITPLMVYGFPPFISNLSESGKVILVCIMLTPGLILLTLWYVAIPVCVMERRGPFQSVSRSNALIKGARLKLFAFFMLQLALSFISYSLPYAVGSFAGYWGQFAVQFPGVSLYYAFTGVLTAVIYYELLVEKQGVDSNRVAAVFD